MTGITVQIYSALLEIIYPLRYKKKYLNFNNILSVICLNAFTSTGIKNEIQFISTEDVISVFRCWPQLSGSSNVAKKTVMDTIKYFFFS